VANQNSGKGEKHLCAEEHGKNVSQPKEDLCFKTFQFYCKEEIYKRNIQKLLFTINKRKTIKTKFYKFCKIKTIKNTC
jgi:hypothetical protein